MNKHCPCCGAEIVPYQQECLNCRVYLLEGVSLNMLSGEGKFRTATAISEEAYFWFKSWMQWLRMPVGEE